MTSELGSMAKMGLLFLERSRFNVVAESQSIQDNNVTILTLELVAPLLGLPFRVVAAVKQDLPATWGNGAQDRLAILGLVVLNLDHDDRSPVPESLDVVTGSI